MKTTSTHSHERANAGSDELSRHRQTGAQPIRIDYNARYVNRQLPTRQLLDLLEDAAPDFFHRAEVVGAWVWIQFPDKQPRAVTARLAEFGFHWNNKRQVWQHPCGPVTVDASPDDPDRKSVV